MVAQSQEFEKLSLKPDRMTDDELLEISLSTLTKQLAPTLAPNKVVSTYVQWLDVHCIRGSTITYHWANTVQQWVHALRGLGYSPDDIIVGLGIWNISHQSRRYIYPPSRNLPHPPEVKLFHQLENVQSYHPGSRFEFGGREYALDHHAVPPPPAYVCNRCGVPGHHLQMCPTNLDPSYDQAPGMAYTCTICHLVGDHYRSLCPLNMEPSSLNQQRRVAAAATGGYYPAPLIANYRELQVQVQIPRGRKRARPLTSSPHSRSSHEGSPTPEKKQESLRKRMRHIEVYEDKLAKGKKLDSTQAEMVRKKADIQRELNALDRNQLGAYRVEYAIHPDRRAYLNASRIQDAGLESFSNMNINQPMRVTRYSEFTQKLIDCQRAEMTEKVNPMKPRPTALDKWELLEADNRDIIAMAVTGMDVTYDPFLNEEIFTKTLAAAAAEYKEPEYPSICGPRYSKDKLPGITSIFDHIPTLGRKHEASESGSGSSLLMDDDVLAAGPLTPLLAPSMQAELDTFYQKNFDPVIAPPKKFKEFNKHADLKFGSGEALNNFIEYYEKHGCDAFGVQEFHPIHYRTTKNVYGHAASHTGSSSSPLLDEEVSAVGRQTPLQPMTTIQENNAIFYPKTFTVPIIGAVPTTKKRIPKDITNIPKKDTKKETRNEQARPHTRAYTRAKACENANVEVRYI